MFLWLVHWREWEPVFPYIGHVLPSFKVSYFIYQYKVEFAIRKSLYGLANLEVMLHYDFEVKMHRYNNTIRRCSKWLRALCQKLPCKVEMFVRRLIMIGCWTHPKTTSVYIKKRKIYEWSWNLRSPKGLFSGLHYPLSWSNPFCSGRDKRGSLGANVRGPWQRNAIFKNFNHFLFCQTFLLGFVFGF